MIVGTAATGRTGAIIRLMDTAAAEQLHAFNCGGAGCAWGLQQLLMTREVYEHTNNAMSWLGLQGST